MARFLAKVESDPDEAADNLYEWLDEVIEGKSKRMKDCADMLYACYLADEFDIITEFIEELPDETPKEFLSYLINYECDDENFVDEIVCNFHPKLDISEADLSKLIKMEYKPNAGDSEEYNGSKCGRATVAENRNATREFLSELATDEAWEIKYRVALNPNIDEKVADLLIGEGKCEVNSDKELILCGLGINSKTDLESLKKLAHNENINVRSAVFQNKSSTSEIKAIVEQNGIDPKFGTSGSRLFWWTIY